jgi:ornithine carbamoyltransferase
VGMRFAIAAPKGYEFESSFVQELMQEVPDLDLLQTNDPAEAVTEACAVYTDVWASMGQEAEMEQRQKDFAAYQVNAALMAKAPADALFMHCLPARRGEEVTDEVMDSEASVIVRQAGNRMHAQKGILAWLLGAQP